MDPICCLLGICCPPGSPEQLEALEAALAKMDGIDEAKAKKIAHEIAKELKHFTDKLAKCVESAA